MGFLLLLAGVCFLPVALAQQMDTEVISLGYRSVNEVIPIVSPLVAPSGSVSGLQSQLVVTATPRQLAEVRKVLAKLDSPPVRLLISVKSGGSHKTIEHSASVQGEVGNIAINNEAINKSGVTMSAADNSRGMHNDPLSMNINSHQRTQDEKITQQVQVIEGSEAYIATGEEIPVRNIGSVVGPGGIYPYSSTEFYPAVTGFYVIPRVNGDEVFLQLNTVSRKRNAVKMTGYYPPQAAMISNVSTTITGKLGDWLEIGSVDQSSANSKRGIAAVSKQRDNTTSVISVRVEKIQSR